MGSEILIYSPDGPIEQMNHGPPLNDYGILTLVSTLVVVILALWSHRTIVTMPVLLNDQAG